MGDRGVRGFLLLLLVSMAVPAEAQRRSQLGTVSQRVGSTDIALRYNRPVARGRVLFGELVPWNDTWHPGADSASTIAFSRDVMVEGRELAAGRYTLWTIPGQQKWTVVFSRAVDVWHTAHPDRDQDALRVDVTPERGAHMETMAFYFPVVGPDSAVLRLHWGEVVVPLRIRTK